MCIRDRIQGDAEQAFAWDEFRKDHRLRRMHNIGQEEMNVLAQVASLGEVGRPRDFIYILNAVRHALGR